MKAEARLDARQIRILEDYFARTLGGETMEQIAKDNGISRSTLSKWKNTNHGKQLYAAFMKEHSTDDMPLFFQKLKEGMLKGSFKHLELYSKIHGLLAPNKQEIVTEEKTKASDRVITNEELDKLFRDLNPTPEEKEAKAKREKERQEENKRLNEIGRRNVLNFGRVADNDR